MTTPPRNPLAQRLRDARGQMKSKDLAARADMPASKASKIETGRQLPTPEDLQAWAEVTGAGTQALAQWQSMLDQILADRHSLSDALRAGAEAMQREYNETTERCTDFRFYAQVAIPRFLQTPAYTRALVQYNYGKYRPEVPIDSEQAQREIDRAVAERQAGTVYLYQERRRFHLLIDEAVLRRRRFDPEVERVQLSRLQSVIGLPNVRLGVLALDRRNPAISPVSFDIYDDQVYVETVHREDIVVRTDDVAMYLADFDAMAAMAVEGAEAHQLIEDIRQTIIPQ